MASNAWKYLLIILLILCGNAEAATYYASPTGSGSTCSTGSPCSVSGGITKMSAGDTLLLKDGTYTGDNYMIAPTKSGSDDSTRIIISAENDGGAIVDGENARRPLFVSGKQYITIQGIIFRNSSLDVGSVSSSSNIQIKRCSFYTAASGNNQLFVTTSSSNVLVEDSVASQKAGSGRYCFVALTSHDVTFRRNFCKYINHSGLGGPCAAFSIYGSYSCIVENNVADFTNWGGTECTATGEKYFSNMPGIYGAVTNNSYYGNVGYTTGTPYFRVFNGGSITTQATGLTMKDNVFVNFYDGIYVYEDTYEPTATIENNTLYNAGTSSDWQSIRLDGGTMTLKNNSFIASS